MNFSTNSRKFQQIPTLVFVPFWGLVLLFFSLFSDVHAITLDAQIYERNLLHDVQYLEDVTGQLSIEQVRQKGDMFKTWTQAGTDLNFGFTHSTYWIKIPLSRLVDAPRDWLLELHYAKYKQLKFYTPKGDVIVTGEQAALSSRAYYDRVFVFPVQVDAEPSDYYLSVTSQYPLTIPLKVWQPNAYREQQQIFHALQFMYFGALTLLAMYGLFIYLAIRDQRFLVYFAYILAIGLGNFSGNGYGRLWLWPDLPLIDEISQTNLLCLGGAFAVMFSRLMMIAENDRSWLHHSMQFSQRLFFFSWALTFLNLVSPGLLMYVSQLLMLNALFMSVLVSIACVKAYLQRRPGTRFFVIGWVILSIGIAIASLRGFNLIASNTLTIYAVQLSTMFEMVLMAMALADLLRLEQQAFSQTQKEALEAKQSLLSLTLESEDKLRKAVAERTEQLQVALKTEQELRKQYVRFGSIISHEFRNPLTIIQSQTSLMRKEHELGIDDVRTRLSSIGSATQRLKLMFDKWLYSDDVNHKLDHTDVHALNLHNWLRNFVQSNEYLFLKHPIDLQLHPQVNEILVDEYQLGIALTNLIDNAVKYSPANTQIRLETRLETNWVGIAVHDHGQGIPQEHQAKIFDAFYRVHPENSTPGFGLGLSIVQRIVSAHYGRVELISKALEGTSICIWLPVAAHKASI